MAPLPSMPCEAEALLSIHIYTRMYCNKKHFYYVLGNIRQVAI